MKDKFVWSLVSAVAIFCMGAGATVTHGAAALLSPAAAAAPVNLSISAAVLAVSAAVEGYSLYVAARAVAAGAAAAGVPFAAHVRRGSDPTSVAVLLEDGAAVAGLAIAGMATAATAATGSPVYDALGSLAVGGLLGVTAAFLIQQNRALLIGRSMAAVDMQRVVTHVARDPVVKAVFDAKSEEIGPGVFRFKAEIEFDGPRVAARHMARLGGGGAVAARVRRALEEGDGQRGAATPSDPRDPDAALEAALAEYGTSMVGALGLEVDRIETSIQAFMPAVSCFSFLFLLFFVVSGGGEGSPLDTHHSLPSPPDPAHRPRGRPRAFGRRRAALDDGPPAPLIGTPCFVVLRVMWGVARRRALQATGSSASGGEARARRRSRPPPSVLTGAGLLVRPAAAARPAHPPPDLLPAPAFTLPPIAARARAMPSPSVTALRRWLVFVALLRLLSGRGEEEGGGGGGEDGMGRRARAGARPNAAPAAPPPPPVYLGYFLPARLQTNLFDLKPELGERTTEGGGVARGRAAAFLPTPSSPPPPVNDLYGRTFAVWTAVTCTLCLTCARDPRARGVYAATLASFALALAFFAGEALVFRTMSLASAAQPAAVASVSTVGGGGGRGGGRGARPRPESWSHPAPSPLPQVWMAAGWSYYTRPAPAPAATGTVLGPEASEDHETESVSKFD